MTVEEFEEAVESAVQLLSEPYHALREMTYEQLCDRFSKALVAVRQRVADLRQEAERRRDWLEAEE